MTAGLETYHSDGSVSLSASGSYGIFTEKHYFTAQVPGVTAYFPIRDIYARVAAGRTIVLLFGSSGVDSLEPLPDNTVRIFTGGTFNIFVMEF